jgi:hypothetical protein
LPSVDELTEQQQATNHPTTQTSPIVGCFLAIASVLGSSRFILDQVLMFEVFFYIPRFTLLILAASQKCNSSKYTLSQQA